MQSTAVACISVAMPLMTDSDRATILQTLAGRHEELLAELDLLEKRIETALAATRPPTAPESAALAAAKVA